ncbi:MAG: hypothetical protein WCD53_15315 [Microcoleus sp.]
MTEMYAKSETHASRGKESDEGVRLDANSSENARRISTGTGAQRFQSNREGSKEGNLLSDAIGGMLDQLIDDAEKQLVKSNECIVWYREEVKEYERKLDNFRKLKELHLQQVAAVEAEASKQLDKILDKVLDTVKSSNNHSEQTLAE